jgi:hypothetical protein
MKPAVRYLYLALIASPVNERRPAPPTLTAAIKRRSSKTKEDGQHPAVQCGRDDEEEEGGVKSEGVYSNTAERRKEGAKKRKVLL